MSASPNGSAHAVCADAMARTEMVLTDLLERHPMPYEYRDALTTERDALRLAIAGQPMDPILKNGSYVEMACTTREARAYAKANHAAAEAEVARLAGLLAEAEWKPAEAAPKDGTPVTARIVWTMRWKPYSKIDRQRMGGRAGRWQGANSFGGWDNTDFEPDAIRLKEKPDAK